MIGDLKPYAGYKESGLPWLGLVPERWCVERTKWQFRHQKKLNADGKQTNILSLTLRGVVNNNPDDPEGLVPKDYRTYQLFAKGDLVFKLIDLENLRTSRVGLVHEDGIMSSAYVRLVPSSLTNMRYFFHQFYDLYARGIYNQLGAGVRSTLSSSDLLNVGIAIPPPGEQAAIARFLDWANGRLERAILAKRKAITLLNEQKQAIIHRAVTRGLDQPVPMKPTGIPWISDIPAHWSLLPNRALLRIRKVLVGERHTRYQLLSLTKRGVIVRDLSELRGKFSADMGTSQEVRSGDLVFCLFDVPETPRTIGLSSNDGMITGAYTVMECADPEMAKFLELFYIAMDDRKLLSPIYSGVRNTIPKDRFLGAKTPIPPASERAAIQAAVQNETAIPIQTIMRLEREIELLREYRTRLVADVVTGKLDVREAAARLPEEVPQDTVESDADLGEDLDMADEEATA
jgi:type I restriction enzyme S subunit